MSKPDLTLILQALEYMAYEAQELAKEHRDQLPDDFLDAIDESNKILVHYSREV